MKTFVVRIIGGPRTRFSIEDEIIAGHLSKLIGEAMQWLSDGQLPAVTVEAARPGQLCQACRARLAVQNELCPECLAKARSDHAEAYAPKPCRCEICTSAP